MSVENEYLCEIWVAESPRGGWLNQPEWLPADEAEWGNREDAVDIAAAWEDEGYTARIVSRTKKGVAA